MVTKVNGSHDYIESFLRCFEFRAIALGDRRQSIFSNSALYFLSLIKKERKCLEICRPRSFKQRAS